MRLLSILLILAITTASLAADRPNIVLFLMDDMGYGDCRVYNPESKVAMPNLEALASEGMRFTDAHSASAVCAPTRYSVLTGNYPWRGRNENGTWLCHMPSQVLPGQKTVGHLMQAASRISHRFSAETDHFEKGNVAATGGSKNGASPSMAILHDGRMTAVHASVSPIRDSPLRLCDRGAWDELESQPGKRGTFSGGHFGPNFNRAVLAAGHTWEDLQKFTREISDDVFISRNLEQLRRRGVEMLFHPGTHDSVAYDLAWGGENHPGIPVYLGVNTGHGKRGHPRLERDQSNLAAFLLRHFFPEKVEGVMLTPPSVKYRKENDTLKVTVKFPEDSGEESGRIWWIYERAPDGSPRYLGELIPDANTAEMIHDQEQGEWTAEIKLDPDALGIDFFSNHRKTIRYAGNAYATYLSSPYTRVEIDE